MAPSRVFSTVLGMPGLLSLSPDILLTLSRHGSDGDTGLASDHATAGSRAINLQSTGSSVGHDNRHRRSHACTERYPFLQESEQVSVRGVQPGSGSFPGAETEGLAASNEMFSAWLNSPPSEGPWSAWQLETSREYLDGFTIKAGEGVNGGYSKAHEAAEEMSLSD